MKINHEDIVKAIVSGAGVKREAWVTDKVLKRVDDNPMNNFNHNLTSEDLLAKDWVVV